MADLTAADPVAVVLGWLRGHPSVAAAFGGPEHVSGLFEAPWPRLRVSPAAPGPFDSALWTSLSEVNLEVIDHPGNLTGQAELWRLLTVALLAAAELVDRDVTATDPVVSIARPSGGGWSPLETGQGRWTAGLTVQLHPPLR